MTVSRKTYGIQLKSSAFSLLLSGLVFYIFCNRIFLFGKFINPETFSNMKKLNLKVCALFCGVAFGASVMLFIGQKFPVSASAVSGENEIANKPETRCGWFSNPTPANMWLNDKDGEWVIGMQGGYQAEGDKPYFKPSQWVKTNVNYGYGCACLTVTTDAKEKRILTITRATARPLSACRRDKKLKEPKE